MAVTIRLEHEYAVEPARLWAVARDWACLEESVRGLATFRNLPNEPVHEGQVAKVEVSVLGLAPWSPWTMEILAFDPENRVLQSHEHGGSVTRWDHRLSVEPTELGARLVDEIAIEAGWSTPLYVPVGPVALFAPS